ncbi:MAG: Vmc-like lipoprotein signal peptide domain-containing protein [Candidatus Omnitrophota bacterium]
MEWYSSSSPYTVIIAGIAGIAVSCNNYYLSCLICEV